MSRNCCLGKRKPITKSLITNKKQDSKVVFLGKSGVGKSSIIHRFMQNEFSEAFEVTMGGSFMQTHVTLEKGEFVTLDIWDTAGQERYKSLLSLYYRDAVVAVVVYDIHDQSSFAQLEYWVDTLQEHEPRCTVFLVGNKCETSNPYRYEVQLREFAGLYQMQWLLTSAKTNKNITTLFERVAQVINSMPIKETF